MNDLQTIIRIDHPTDLPNFSRVSLPFVVVYFSYETPIAFNTGRGPIRVVENNWSKTTGKHLSWIDDGAKTQRLRYDVFAEELANAIGRKVLANGEVVWRP